MSHRGKHTVLSLMTEIIFNLMPDSPLSCGIHCALFVYLVGQRCFLDA